MQPVLTLKLRNVIARACEVHSHVCSLLASNDVLTVQDRTGRLKPHTLQSPGMLPVWNIHLSPIPKHVGAVPFREPTLRRQLQIVRDKGHLHCIIVDSACIGFTIIARLAGCTNTLHTIHASGTSNWVCQSCFGRSRAHPALSILLHDKPLLPVITGVCVA